MNNHSIGNINTLGKVSRVLIGIGQAVLIIGFVFSIIFSVASFFLDDDAFHLDVQGSVDLYVNAEGFPVRLSDEDVDILNGQEIKIGKANLKINNAHFEDDEIAVNAEMGMKEMDGGDIAFPLAMGFLYAALNIALIFLITVFGSRLAKAFSKCESPFEENVIQKMKQLGFSMIPWAAVSCIGFSFDSDSFKLSVGSDLNVTAIFLVIIVLLFVYIFDYGAQLQRESDETL